MKNKALVRICNLLPVILGVAWALLEPFAGNAISEEPILVWADNGPGELWRLEPGAGASFVDSTSRSVTNLFTASSDIYWSEVSTYNIWRENLTEQSSLTALRDRYAAGTLTGSPYHIAINPGTNGGGTLFWADPLRISKGLLSQDSSQDTALVSGFGNISTPRALTVDFAHSRIYWADWGRSYYGYPPINKIRSSDFSGTDVRDIVDGIGNVRDLAIDSVAGKLYWADNSVDGVAVLTPRIRRANLDGSALEDVITSGLEYITAIAVDGSREKIYWSDLGLGKLKRANLDGSGAEDLQSAAYVLGLGLIEPTPLPTATATSTSTPQPTPTPTPTSTPVPAETSVPTATVTPPPTETPPPATPTATVTCSPTSSPVPAVRGRSLEEIMRQINHIVADSPPELVVAPEGRSASRYAVTCTLPQFRSVSLSGTKQNLTVQYQLDLKRVPAPRKSDSQHELSKRHIASFRGLRKGRYRIQYRVELREERRSRRWIAAVSRFSRKVTFDVPSATVERSNAGT